MKIANISIADFFEATLGMEADERGLYLQMLLKMYSRESGLPDDDECNARMFGFKRPSSYRKVKDKLLARDELGLYLENGIILDERVVKTVEKLGKKKSKTKPEVDENSQETEQEVDSKVSGNSFESPMQPRGKSKGYDPPLPKPKPKPKPKESSLASSAISDSILNWVKSEFAIGDVEADDLLADQVEQFGAGRVAQAKTDFLARKARGQLKHSSLATFLGFIPQAEPADIPEIKPKRSKAELRAEYRAAMGITE